MKKLWKPKEAPLTPEEDALQWIKKTEAELDIEYVGPDQGMNRQQRRDAARYIARITRRPEGSKWMKHPLLNTFTPYGAKERRKRRMRERMAKKSRQINHAMARR